MNKSMRSIASNTLHKSGVLEAVYTIWLIVMTSKALIVLVKKISIGTFLTFLSRYANLTIILNIIAQIALNLIASSNQKHLIIACGTSLIRST